MRVLIIGATGGTGKQLVSQALERGYLVTAFVRKPEKLRLRHERLTVHKGNVLDYSSVEQVVKGRDAVLCALGHKRLFHPNRILSEGTKNIIQAMAENGVKRFVCETSLGVGSGYGRLGLYYTLFVIPFILQFYWWDKHRQEKIIRQSTLDWVIVRPGRLTNGKKRGVYKHGSQVGNYLWTVRISRANVSDFMLNQLENDIYLHDAPGVCY
ncbi:MAG: NAD(P)-dependent oxidoreductase [Calditrichia bacterium]